MSYGAMYSDTNLRVFQETQFTRMPRGPHSPQQQFEANHWQLTHNILDVRLCYTVDGQNPAPPGMVKTL